MIDGFTQALAAVDKLLDQARAEVARLGRRVKINAEQPSREAHGVPMASASTAVEEQIALFVARGQVAALKSAWAAVARRERTCTDLTEEHITAAGLVFPFDTREGDSARALAWVVLQPTLRYVVAVGIYTVHPDGEQLIVHAEDEYCAERWRGLTGRRFVRFNADTINTLARAVDRAPLNVLDAIAATHLYRPPAHDPHSAWADACRYSNTRPMYGHRVTRIFVVDAWPEAVDVEDHPTEPARARLEVSTRAEMFSRFRDGEPITIRWRGEVWRTEGYAGTCEDRSSYPPRLYLTINTARLTKLS